MFNLSITQKVFVTFTKDMNTQQLENLILGNDKLFNFAFDVWFKIDDVAYDNPMNVSQSDFDYYRNLGCALQI
jgi:hypothetical protein